MDEASDAVDENVDAQLTQISEEAVSALTQPQGSPPEDATISPFVHSEALVAQFHASPQKVALDCLVFEQKGILQPLCFIRADVGSFDISIGRDVSSDVVIPCDNGWCGVSRKAFRLLRTDAGALSLKTSNAVPFFIRCEGKLSRVPSVRPGEQPVVHALSRGDVLVFNSCSLYFREAKTGNSGVADEEVTGRLTDSEDFILATAVQSLEHIRRSAESNAMSRILPNVVSNLSTLLPPSRGSQENDNNAGASVTFKRPRENRTWRGRGRARFR